MNESPVPEEKPRPSAWRFAVVCALVGASCVAGIACSQPPAGAPPALRAPDVPYQPSPMDVVDAMLRLAKVGAADVVYDLGCGDGRIVIAAVREFNARGVCVDIDPQRIVEARRNAHAGGVADRIRFLNQDIFDTDLGEATAVMLFLWPEVNLKLRPKLLRELKPGTRVVSHYHDMGNWRPEKTVRISTSDRDRTIYLWTIPAR